jgi:D-alanyl-D-alanine carboxypeptidase
MKRTKAPSISIGIVKGGKLIRQQTFGKANLELDVDAKEGDLYEIGSITKEFTALAAMLLVEEGKLDLEDPIAKYLPDASDKWKDIRVRHLIYQISGLQDYALVEGLGLVDNFDRAKFMTEMGKLDLDFQPGETWAYSNTNYALLGWIIEKAAGKEYTEFMQERVFKPLGMSKTTFSSPYGIVPRRAAGYMNVAGPDLLRAPSSAASINSDGTIISNIEDMAKWDACVRERKLLKKESWNLMLAPAKMNSGRTKPYGGGLNLTIPGGIEYIGHGGNSSGYSAGYAYYPAAGVSVIVLGNVYAFGGEPMAKQIAELYEPSLKPAAPKPTPKDPNPKRTDLVRNAILDFVSNKGDSPLLDPEITIPMKTKRAAMNTNPSPLAKLTKLEFVTDTAHEKDRLLVYRIETPTRDYVATAIWTPQNKLAQLYLRPDGPPKNG